MALLVNNIKYKAIKCSVVILTAFMLFAIIILYILMWGNPQWHKSIYMFRLNVYPRYLNSVPVPKDYNGRWREWRKDGSIRADLYLIKGVPNGYYKSYYKNGKLELKGNCVDGMPEGKIEYWNSKGELVATGIFRKTFPWEGSFIFNGNVKYYKNGKEISPQSTSPNLLNKTTRVKREERRPIK